MKQSGIFPYTLHVVLKSGKLGVLSTPNVLFNRVQVHGVFDLLMVQECCLWYRLDEGPAIGRREQHVEDVAVQSQEQPCHVVRRLVFDMCEINDSVVWRRRSLGAVVGGGLFVEHGVDDDILAAKASYNEPLKGHQIAIGDL